MVGGLSYQQKNNYHAINGPSGFYMEAAATPEGGIDFSRPIFMKMDGAQGMSIQPGLNDKNEVDFSKPITITMQDGSQMTVTSPINEKGELDLNRLQATDAYKLTNLAVKQYFGDSILGSIAGNVLGCIAGVIAMGVHSVAKATGVYDAINDSVNARIKESMGAVTPEGINFLIAQNATQYMPRPGDRRANDNEKGFDPEIEMRRLFSPAP